MFYYVLNKYRNKKGKTVISSHEGEDVFDWIDENEVIFIPSKSTEGVYCISHLLAIDFHLLFFNILILFFPILMFKLFFFVYLNRHINVWPIVSCCYVKVHIIFVWPLCVCWIVTTRGLLFRSHTKLEKKSVINDRTKYNRVQHNPPFISLSPLSSFCFPFDITINYQTCLYLFRGCRVLRLLQFFYDPFIGSIVHLHIY